MIHRRLRRIAALPLVLVAVLAPSEVGRASMSTSTTADQYLSLGHYDQLNGSSFNLDAFARVTGTTADTTATPTVTYEAVAYERVCSPNTCTYVAYGRQTVSPTALQFDPLGNSGTFRATLLRDPSTPGAPGVFDLTFTRPTSLSVCNLCVQPNGWYDPMTGKVGASASGSLLLDRYGYEVSGTFGDTSLPPADGQYVYRYTFYRTALNETLGAVLP